LALLGWDYQSSLEQKLGDALPFHERRDKHSLYEIFTLPQLVQAFELTNLSRRKAMVNTDKLDFLNKMTLRRRAGSLGKDEDLVEMGKRREGWGDRTGDGKEELVKRYQADLRAMPTLAGK
jgi:glutamyl-tRNA synthetase